MSFNQEREFKGKPALFLKDGAGDMYPLILGIAKMKKILNSLPDIVAFVAKHDKLSSQTKSFAEQKV